MARPNVHTASRGELVEAGIRAELADEILKLRRKGKIALVALDEVPGVGPAGLAHEQTRQTLDLLQALTMAVDWNQAVKAVDWDRVLKTAMVNVGVRLRRQLAPR